METKSIFVGFTVPPSLEDIEEIADMILDDLPKDIEKYIGKLKVTVEDFPDAFIEEEMELETPFDLLGCYQSAGPSSLVSTSKRQDTLYLYRRPILDLWVESCEDITLLINRIIIQEIGNHFGFSNDEIEMYEEDMLSATASNISVS